MGRAGLLVAVCLLSGGIVSIVTRNKEKNGGNIACIILYLLGAFLGLPLAGGGYSDLRIWGAYSCICGIMHLISTMNQKKKGK